MIYPKEGSVLNSNPAAIVDAPWVTADQTAAAGSGSNSCATRSSSGPSWTAGFRPARAPALPSMPSLRVVGPRRRPAERDDRARAARPRRAREIIDSWGAVKNPAIVTFVVDTSGSMEGEPIDQVKEGLIRLSTRSAPRRRGTENQVGLVTFSSERRHGRAAEAAQQRRFDIARRDRRDGGGRRHRAVRRHRSGHRGDGRGRRRPARHPRRRRPQRRCGHGRDGASTSSWR